MPASSALRQLAAEIEEARPSNPDLELLGIVLFDMDTSATRERRPAGAGPP